ncbi:2-dehydro-3-deoxygalactonokinase [Massilia glaciei]|uniref:2-dehydro-3-deoxygalactonokinase n=2 Tax=Massilia glaciei TaxID=1524097 RepID=A0A2U2HE01_9BURK|nr:2-dehydro-3-deoxygalactonokinase [Massilia glaciei]
MIPAHADKMLGVDWGTSNRRAYLVERGGRCLARHEDGQGMLAVGGDFAGSLAALRQTMRVDDAVPVVMSGMIGSAGGWQEVPYLDIATPLAALASHLAPVAGHPGCLIVPGYCTRADGVDVMRGEETQLLGALALGVGDGTVVLPGTHSKWVQLRGGRIARFATFMTGELFAMLAAGGTLAAIMGPGEDDDDAFAAGIAQARLGLPLSQSLFGARARVVAKDMAPSKARSFVSGLLIGTEFTASGAGPGARLSILGSNALGAHYARAARHFCEAPAVLDADAVYLAALTQLLQGSQHE